MNYPSIGVFGKNDRMATLSVLGTLCEHFELGFIGTRLSGLGIVLEHRGAGLGSRTDSKAGVYFL